MAKVNPIPLPPVPPPGGKPGGLAEKISAVISAGFSVVINRALEPFAQSLRYAVGITLEDLEEQAVDFSRPILQMMADNEALPAWARKYFQDMLAPRHAVQLAAILPLVAGLLMAMVMAAAAAVFEVVRYAANRVTRPFRLTFQASFIARRRGLSSDRVTKGDLYDQGMSDDRMAVFDEVSETRLDVGSLGQLVLRGEMSNEQMVEELYRQGWNREQASRIIELLQIIPTPIDLISMAVKEAWDESFATLAQTDAGFPGPWVESAKKMGLSEDWCRRYWRAHWQLPSAQMGFEMLHRGIITDQQLDQLLKALDISPFWRPLLKQIAYNPYTRVDTRRMFNMGIIDRAGVKRSYLDQGYDDQHAENLTEFTVRDATDTDKEATKGDILSGYSTGMLSKAEAIDWLVLLDFPRDLADFYIAKEDAKKAQVRKTKRITAIQKLYTGGEIGAAEASTRLTALGLAGNEVQEYLDDWTIERENKTERPTASQLETFLKQDVIDESKYRDGLKFLGFQSQYIDWFAASALGEKADAARKAEQNAKAEQERLRTAKAKSDYAIAKAALDVDEATLATAIAEIQVAASGRKSRYQSDLAIARKGISVAALQADAKSDIDYLQSQIDGLEKSGSALRETIAQENTAIAQVQEALAKLTADTNTQIASETDETVISQLKATLKATALETAHIVAQHRVVIAQAEQDLSSLATQRTDLQTAIHARQAKLQSDLEIAQRIKSVIDIESEYQRDIADYSQRIGALRLQLSDLKEQKAKLSVTLQTVRA